MAQATKKGKNPLIELTKVLENSNGAAKQMADTMLKGAPGAVVRFQSAWEGLAISIAKSGILDAFASLLETLTGLFSWLSKVNPTFLKVASIALIVLAAVGPLLVMFGFMVQGIAALGTAWIFLSSVMTGFASVGGIATVAMGALKFAALGLGKALLFLALNPVGLIITAVAALALGAILLIKNWTGVTAFFANMWDRITSIFGRGTSTVIGFLKAIPGIGAIVGGIELLAGAGRETRGALGPGVGAEGAIREVAESREERTNNAAVAVDFKNIPRGTKVKSEAEGPFNLNLGFAGGLQ
jgi:hypothetical protein